jgi:hypothetical protein
MRYFFVGLLAGIAIAVSPVLMHTPSISLYAQWKSDPVDPVMTSPDPEAAQNPPVITGFEGRIVSYSQNGSVLSMVIPGDSPSASADASKKKDSPLNYSLSAAGGFYATYRKTGSEIEYLSLAGDRFWKIRSQQYPYLSTNGKLVLLLVADLSRIDILNNNGLTAGAGALTGRMCTVISFAKGCDAAAAGFLDGRFYVLSDRGDLIYSGSVPSGSMVKSIALSDKALRCAVHYGDGKKDGILTVNLEKKKTWAFTLPNILQTKTAVHITDDGTASIIDSTRILFFTIKGKVIADIPIDRQKPGHSVIARNGNLYLMSYRLESGGSALLASDGEGNTLMKKSFPAESALDCGFTGTTAWARGINTVYAWRAQ